MIWAAIPAIMSAVTGMMQQQEGKSTFNRLMANKPEYEIPEAARQALAMAQNQIGDMPGTAVQQQRIDTSAANMIQAAMQSGNPLAALGSIQANQNQAGLNLQTENARYRQDATSRAQDALGTYAQYKDMEFQMNEFAPWKDQVQRAENMYGAGSKNLYGGVDAISSIATAFLSK